MRATIYILLGAIALVAVVGILRLGVVEVPFLVPILAIATITLVIQGIIDFRKKREGK